MTAIDFHVFKAATHWQKGYEGLLALQTPQMWGSLSEQEYVARSTYGPEL
ncbi:hypothetical protein GV827_19140 [Sulfitobacter sp. JBTF-M27]|uniref:Uncharacterized protein n=1 Tax=Sulfitobacter sediminilitoris TaxID=2698830 RepID=A0A6P0CE83_9RHOB|nr:hypothetical protein [Sulfitobacter sediminilitoris]NEK24499.1 hypothetical protein [Sulfitobacter sediminilitoris]